LKRYDLIVIGAGPAGLSAAVEGAKRGLEVAVFDENDKPGGQLFKQIHKFFGSKEHKAKIRGYNIGKELLNNADQLGVEIILNAEVVGLYPFKEVVVNIDNRVLHYRADTIAASTGASEKMISFPGWTLPGVIGAGAAQTMMNIHGVKPGEKILMLGSGNVGLVVTYQLLQAGIEVAAVVDASPQIGGYGVHAAKVARTEVPFYTSHTIVRAEGEDSVTGAVIAEVDENWNIIEGTEKRFAVDTICLSVGLSPMSKLFSMAGCELVEVPAKGGIVPVCDEYGETSVSGIYAAGDVSGIEEASSAMIEGRIAGTAAAHKLGYIGEKEFLAEVAEQKKSLAGLRQGMFAPENKGKKLTKTEEGYQISDNLLKKGYISSKEIEKYPGIKDKEGIHPVIECTQNIPCNPCQDSCPNQCIIVDNITSLPEYIESEECSGCGICAASCPGQAVFLIDNDIDAGYSYITFPYEFSPLPAVGKLGTALDRSGEELCEAEIVDLKSIKAFDNTHLVTMKVPLEYSKEARFFKVEEE
jgi:thioredoxin reductase/Fe-S-cluster-containing hydrogenase component 2